jgi:hypothetical protein
MKQLKTKKILQIDISIQVSILILTFFAILITELGYAFMLFYFVLGGYQLLSFMLHYLIRKKRNGNTAVYAKLILTALIGLVICILLQSIPQFEFMPLFLYLIILLFLDPFLALYYLIISVIDLQEIKKQLLNAN